MAIQSDGQKCLLRVQTILTLSVIYQNVEKLGKKNASSGIIFHQENAPVHKSNFIGNFFSAREREREEPAGMVGI